MGLGGVWCQKCECNLMADKEEKGGKDTFIFCEVLVIFLTWRYFAVCNFDKNVHLTKANDIFIFCKKKKCSGSQYEITLTYHSTQEH